MVSDAKWLLKYVIITVEKCDSKSKPSQILSASVYGEIMSNTYL